MKKWPALILLLLLILAPGRGAAAQETAVQRLTGHLEPGDLRLYRASDLRAGQTLSARAATTAGNLDPLLGILPGDADTTALLSAYRSALAANIAAGQDPLRSAGGLRDSFFLAWDDDGGGGLAAALSYDVPAAGDYLVLVGGALSLLGAGGAGDFELLLGLDAPGVRDGTAVPAGPPFAALDADATPPRAGVQVLEGTLDAERPQRTLTLTNFLAADTLTALLQPQGGAPGGLGLTLRNFAGKPLANGRAQAGGVLLEHTFAAEAPNSRLTLTLDGAGAEEVAYRLVLGANAGAVLDGAQPEYGRAIAREPIEVRAGLRLEQMINVVEAQEFFEAAAVLRLAWRDPALAFNPETCACDAVELSGAAIDDYFAGTERRFPEFSIPNQQGNRWQQNRLLQLQADGTAVYQERFTTNFQVDFDFRKYPFDTQEFFVRVDSLLPEEEYFYTVEEDFAVIAPDNGEDEFILSAPQSTISSWSMLDGVPRSRYTFAFSAPRELAYYLLQIFVPILLIIGVSWFTFFLKDYMLRIEVASGNLLLFIAFSFSLADNYPRLGYLTFLDAIMAGMFVVNAAVILYNVILRRLEMDGRGEQVERIDTVMDWVYPLIYIVALGVLAARFL